VRRIALRISYRGTGFSGFQIQPSSTTVQSTLEERLAAVCDEPVRVIPAGRTDAGVHAAGQVVHFDTNSRVPCSNLVRALNSTLPEQVRVLKAEEVDRDFHARFRAKKREYIYVFSFNAPVPLYMQEFVWDLYPGRLNMSVFRKAMRLLKGTHDFSGLCASSDKNEDKRRTIYQMELRRSRPKVWLGSTKSSAVELWSMRIVADAFLQRMVRLIVGMLVEVASGKKTMAQLRYVLSGKKIAGTRLAAPARGLSLVNVQYECGMK